MPQHAPVRRRTAPIHPRRVSGPVRPRAVAAGIALPAPGRTGVFERLRALPDKRVVDRLLRGRLCIWVIGVMLGGIVAMQVSLLRLNAGISRAVVSASTLERQNAALEDSIAKRTAGDRVNEAATALGMIDPNAGETSWLHARVATDPALAVKRMKPPSEAAAAIMDNGGKVPGALNPTSTTQVAGAGGTTTAAVTAVPTPVPTVVQAQVTPVPTATPIPTPVQTAPVAGGAAAPQG